jgi:hypothetical protein
LVKVIFDAGVASRLLNLIRTRDNTRSVDGPGLRWRKALRFGTFGRVEAGLPARIVKIRATRVTVRSPKQGSHMMKSSLRILLLVTAFDSLAQRVYVELVDAGHDLAVGVVRDANDMTAAVESFPPDVIVAPYLKSIIPESILAHVHLLDRTPRN